MRAERSNLRAGIASLAGIAGFSLLLWGWIEWRASGRVDYTLRFSREQGVYGLAPGKPVQVGGITRGEVASIEPEVVDGHLRAYLVRILVDREVPVTDRTRFESRSEGVSGDRYIVATRVGRRAPMTQSIAGGGARGLLPPGSSINASDEEGFLAWGGSANAASMRELAEAWFPDAASGPGLGARLKSGWDEIYPAAEGVAKDAGALTESVERDYTRWRERFSAVRTEADAAMAKLGVGESPGDAAVMPGLRAMGEDLRNIPRIETARATRAADAFDAAIASVKALGRRSADLREMLADPDTSLGSTGADYSLAAQDLDATGSEAITAPWRLLESPGRAERALEAREDLARLYAEAAADHQRAMKGIEDALRRDGPLLAQDPALAGLLRTRLDAANALFEGRLAEMEALLLGPAGAPARAPAAP